MFSSSLPSLFVVFKLVLVHVSPLVSFLPHRIDAREFDLTHAVQPKINVLSVQDLSLVSVC